MVIARLTQTQVPPNSWMTGKDLAMRVAVESSVDASATKLASRSATGRVGCGWDRRPDRSLGIPHDHQEVQMSEAGPPLPPFTEETAIQKIRAAEDAWNTRDPERVSLAYTVDSQWRNRSEIFQGRPKIVEFLTRKWNRELDYRLIKELWAYTGNRIAVRFTYEYHDDSGNWFRAYGNENWEFDENGLMRQRHASINDLPIRESERKFHWDRSRPRPADHPGLTGRAIRVPHRRVNPGLQRTATVNLAGPISWMSLARPA